MSIDAEFLLRYADEQSAAALAERVRQHLNLVCFAAPQEGAGFVEVLEAPRP